MTGEGRDLLDRCTFEVRSLDGEGLGTAVLVAADRVLTCAHVVEEMEEVDLAEDASAAPLRRAKVLQRGDPGEADDLALLALAEPFEDRQPMAFAHPRRGMGFGSIGFPRERSQVLGRILGPEPQARGWLRIETDSEEAIEKGFSGSAVWALDARVAVGLITHLGEARVAYAIPTEVLQAFFPELSVRELGGEEQARARSRQARITGLYGVPDTRSVRFVGRGAAMARLRGLLEGGEGVAVSASIEGLAGIGKTELALQLVHELGEEGAFPGGIFWFDAEARDLTPAWGTTIADALGLAEGPPAERGKLALNTVSGAQAPVLLVLDNVERWTASEHPGPLPSGAHVRYLLTSRQRSLGGGRFAHLDLGILNPPFDRQLLERVAGRDLSGAPGYEDLLRHLGGHALALELAGAFLSEFPEESPASYLEALTHGEDPATEVSDLVRYERTVHQTFAALWDRLPEETRAAWQLAACFEPEPATPALADACGLDASARRALRRLHLLDAGEDGKWRLHRLTREFGRGAGTEEERERARRGFVEGCVEFAQPFDWVTGAMAYLPDKPHLDSAVALAPEVLVGDEHRFEDFLNSVGLARKSAADYSGAELLYRLALASRQARLGGDHADVAALLNNLAQLLQATNRLEEAEPLMRRALSIDEASYGEEHPNVARELNNLAQLRQAANRLEEAEPLMRRAL
ncbi:MAG: tetratricopeptide repeat protein, partial [Acidobacteria bacterium]|nr:tetratricopeptide repeat protein [Acidobacteriota bacterium]